MERVKRVRRWGTCIIRTASPAAPAVRIHTLIKCIMHNYIHLWYCLEICCNNKWTSADALLCFACLKHVILCLCYQQRCILSFGSARIIFMNIFPNKIMYLILKEKSVHLMRIVHLTWENCAFNETYASKMREL